MLLGQDGGRHEHGDLFAAHDGLESGANGDLGLAEADIAADEAIHRLLGFHVGLGGGDGGELIRSFPVEERSLELALPFLVWRKGEALLRLTIRVHFEQARGVVGDSGLGVFLGSGPLAVAEFAERRVAFANADITRDEVTLLKRHVETRVVGIGQNEHFLAAAFAARQHFHPFIAADAMLEVDHVVAIDQF